MSDNFENNNGSNSFEDITDSFEIKPEYEQAQPTEEAYDSEQSISEPNVYEEDSFAKDSADFAGNADEKPTESSQASDDGRFNNAYSQNQTYGFNGNTQQGGYQYGSQYQNGYQNNGYSQQNGYGQNGYQFNQPQQTSVPPYEFGNNQYNNYVPQNGGSGSSKGKKIVVAIVAVAVIIGILAVAKSLLFGNGNSSTPSIETTTAALQNTEEQTTVSESNQVYIAPTEVLSNSTLTGDQIADKVRPSVVGVMTYKDGQLAGEGSGVVMGVDSTGKYTYIITCAHVISDKGVTFGILTLDGKNYEAKMVATDTRTDIGVLKVETTDLTAAEFGDSGVLKVGETIYAIGNPGGSDYFGSMTSGIISAIDRSVSGTYTMTCVQHDAAINPGNSGGALVNKSGQVVGINSSKIAATDYEGMGFAVPMAIVKSVVDALIQYGYVPNRPKLGIEYASVSSYQLYSMVVAIKGLPAGSLVIAGISNDSSLANTNVQVGDLIIAVNGKNMDTSDVLLDLINTGAVGDSLTLTLCRVESRTYKTTTFDVTINLIEDKGDTEKEEETTVPQGAYNYGGASSFEDFFRDYFGF